MSTYVSEYHALSVPSTLKMLYRKLPGIGSTSVQECSIEPTSSFTATTMTAQSPTSIRMPQKEPSLGSLPRDIRLEIWIRLLEVSQVPRSYSYTGLPPKAMNPDREELPTILWTAEDEEGSKVFWRKERRRRRRLKLSLEELEQDFFDDRDNTLDEPSQATPATVTKTHGMVLVNKTLGAEYRMVYYNRTDFFFRIHCDNVLTGIPQLREAFVRQDAPQIPNFWHSPNALFHNLWRCTLHIELGELEQGLCADRLDPDRGAMKDTAFDKHMSTAVRNLLAQMHQLRTVKIFWVGSIQRRAPLAKLAAAGPEMNALPWKEWPEDAREVAIDYSIDAFFVPIVSRMLLKKDSLREFLVHVGRHGYYMECKASRVGSGPWIFPWGEEPQLGYTSAPENGWW
ncbi:hypothetical protein IQ07DRAFT_267386 [Pyrenochaeta sp. DS3sAY3a]|nr:hypothetical protein IQ07DRAFT_267386 [Pyrenochaeta sp. DS3sAY3a]